MLNDDNSLLLAGPSTLHFNLDDNGNVLSSTMNFHNFSNQVFRDSGTTYTSRSNTLRISGAGYVDTGESINDIYAKNNLVYIAAGSAGLRLWDVTDKNAPYIIGTDASQFASSVVVNGNYAYVSFFPTVRVVDISTPNNPIVVGEFDANGGSLSNIAPVANAFLAQSTQSGETITLNGTFSNDPDGNIVSYLWEQVSGTPMVLNHANTTTPSFTALYNADEQSVIQSSYFKLTVTDNEGATGSDTVQINISKNTNGNGVIGGDNGSNTNTPPVADAGSPLNVKSRQRRVKLDGRGSYDSDGTIVKYAWKQVSGKNISLRRANRSVARFRAPRVTGAAIQLVFELTVTDNKGAETSSSVTVTVRK